MAYFEDLAVDLDCAQYLREISSYAKDNASSKLLPFEIADEIAEVACWAGITDVRKPITTYLTKLGNWFDTGIEFDREADDCCEEAEGYLVESILRNQHKDMIDFRSAQKLRPEPAVIFTESGVAVAYKKSVGVDTTYGLRDSKAHKIGAEVFATHNFYDVQLETHGFGVIAFELAEGQTFTPIRPAVTSFDLAERERFASNHLATALEYTALTLSHETTVQYIDDILLAHNAARGHKPALA